MLLGLVRMKFSNIKKVRVEEDKISIVILGYNGWSMTHQLLMDVKQKCPQAYEVIVVDNASEDVNVQRGLEFWKGLDVLPLQVVTLKSNRGFIGGMNVGLKKATGDVIVLLSNDVRITGNSFWGDLATTFKASRRTLLGGIVYAHDTGWNVFKGRLFPYVEGWFLAATKEFWDIVGGLEEMYAPSDFEDVHLSTQAIEMGYTLQTIGGIQHLGAKTYGYNSERLERTNRNRLRFAKYWNVEI